MSLTIIKHGICDTVQDLGRWGFQHTGINPGGVMDRNASRMVNILSGNDPGDAVIEMHFPAPVMVIEKPCLLVIGGGDFSPTINDEAIALLQPVWIAAGSELRFPRHRSGQWCYIAVQGGLTLDPWMNSYATHLKAGAGGWQGRALQTGDRISFRRRTDVWRYGQESVHRLPWRAVPLPDPAPADTLWIVEGPEWPMLTAGSRKQMEEASFLVQPSSDRMGYSLKGPVLTTAFREQMVSAAVDYGTLQLLPDGQLMILMADHQTTGGYPRVGQVIKAHLPKLAQYSMGKPLRFQRIQQEAAALLWLQQYRHLELLKFACGFKHESLKLQQ